MTAKRSRNYHDQHRWKKKSPKIDRLRKKPVTDPLREDVTVIPCRELLSSISFRISCHPRKRTRKIENGKKLSDTQTEEDPSNFRHKQSSRVRAVSPFRSSLLRESKKVTNKEIKKQTNKSACRGMTKFIILFDNVGNGI